MVKNEVYEKEIERIAPKLEELKSRPFDEIMQGLSHEILYSPITKTLIFALTYVLDPSKFYIKVGYWAREGEYVVRFTVDVPLGGYGTFFLYKVSQFDKMPTDKEARDLIKESLAEVIEVEGLLKKAKKVVDTCKVIQET